MNTFNFPIVSWIVFLPLLGAVLIAFLGKEKKEMIRSVALFVLFVDFFLSLLIWFAFDSSTAAMQFVERHSWVESLGINYLVGIDGISILLIMLTTFLGPLIIISSWKSIEKRVKEYHMMMLLLQTSMLGVFVCMDLFLFYVFWEAMLIPMYFIIGVWGGKRRIYATVKFFIYTMAGSVLMLVAILYLYFYNHTVTNVYTFELSELIKLNVPLGVQNYLFIAFAVAFAIKVPLFPFHTWLPDAHVEAPTAGSVILAGVLLKMGTYGYMRFCLPMFPSSTYTFVPVISVLAIIGIIYGALVSMVQPDMKKLVAYSSVSHLGFVMLGIFALNTTAMQGGMIQMINHGLSTGMLFLVVGMIYERRHTREISEYGGIARVMPIYAAFFMIAMLSSVGLPGLNGFIGEFLILVGTYQSSPVYAIFAASGVIFAAVYLLWMYQRVFFGPVNNEKNKVLKDLNIREIGLMVPIVIMFIFIGVYPNYFLSKSEVSVDNLQKFVENKKIAQTIKSENNIDSKVTFTLQNGNKAQIKTR